MNDSSFIGYIDLTPNYTISIYPETDEEPIMHVDIHCEDIPDSCIFLTENKYYGSESLEADFSEEGLKYIDDFLREVDESGKSNWEKLCEEWNRDSSRHIDFPDAQPDYIKTKEVIERR